MRNPEPVSLSILETSATIYRNLAYHRSMILEPVRQMAFRNMRHLSDAMISLPKPEDTDIDSPEAGAWIEQVQNWMLKDQGLEPSDLNRLLLQKATFTPVKLYEALIYAEMEYLDKMRARYPLSDSTDLRDFLQDHSGFVERSKPFRHGILHPNEQSIPSEEAWVLRGFQNELPVVQQTIDTIVNCMRETLHADTQRSLNGLPEFQRCHCYANFLSWLTDDDANMLDDTMYRQLVQEIQRLDEQYSRISRETDSTELTETQSAMNQRILRCMINLHPPRAKDVLAGVSIQTGMNPHHLRRAEFMASPPSGLIKRDRHLNHVINNLPNYNFIIDAVGILLNETAERLPTVVGTAGEALESNDRLRSVNEELTIDEGQSMAGLAKVSSALLGGLVDTYQNVRMTNPQMANHLIDAVIDDEATKTTIRNFRNVVFHVACPACDPYQLDFDASHVAPETLRELFIGFSMFCGSVAAHTESGNSANSP